VFFYLRKNKMYTGIIINIADSDSAIVISFFFFLVIWFRFRLQIFIAAFINRNFLADLTGYLQCINKLLKQQSLSSSLQGQINVDY